MINQYNVLNMKHDQIFNVKIWQGIHDTVILNAVCSGILTLHLWATPLRETLRVSEFWGASNCNRLDETMLWFGYECPVLEAWSKVTIPSRSEIKTPISFIY